ncbi:MAG: hypothetical protein RR092_05390 [Oscillospiraceae bacterium]
MPFRNETLFKWLAYAAATLLCALVQTALLGRLSLWGVFPFVYPLLAAIFAMLEGPQNGMLYGIFLGVCCDLTIPAPIPCFYTLLLPVVGLVAALMGKGLLSAGFFCGLAVSAVAFVLEGGFYMLLLVLGGQSPFPAAPWLTLRELCVSLPFALPVYFLFGRVYRTCNIDN